MPEKKLMHLKYDIQKGEPPASELVLLSMGSYYLISHRHTQIDHRGQGLGSKLLDEAKKENTELRIETSQLEVINWALKNGFNSEVIILKYSALSGTSKPAICSTAETYAWLSLIPAK